MAAVGREVEKREGRMEGNRVVVVSALQFACTDDVPTNLNTAERFLSSFSHLFIFDLLVSLVVHIFQSNKIKTMWFGLLFRCV